MTDTERLIRDCIAKNDMMPFYNLYAWRKLSKEVMRECHNECQHCKARGKMRKAELIHHTYEVREFPQYALSKTVVIDGEERINLIALCNECHEKAHNRFIFDADKKKKKFTNIERW